jgi:D-glycerate 3-kinase
MTSLEALADTLALPPSYLEIVESAWRPLAHRLGAVQREAARPVLIGINGAQGSGKSTVAAFLAEALLPELGLRAAVLSLDDLYLGRAERTALARDIHPLFATRGVPGTHDVALGTALLETLLNGRSGNLPMPRFDKGLDDRLPASAWPTLTLPVDVILFEGWCIAAEPQTDADLAQPINRLEAEEDSDGIWRRHVNACLAGPYRALFDPIDFRVMLRPPSFDAVVANRALQERKLAERATRAQRPMDAAALERFMLHYERLTRHIFATMPDRADALFDIAEDRSVHRVR